MRFVVPIRDQLALSIAAAHGAADVARHPTQLVVYGLALLPLSGRATTSAFAAASIVHFAADVGIVGSLMLHAAAVAVAASSVERAVRLVLVYMLTIHVPRLVFTLAKNSRFASLACMLWATLLFARHRVPRVVNERYCFGHRDQMLVACHVLISIMFPM